MNSHPYSCKNECGESFETREDLNFHEQRCSSQQINSSSRSKEIPCPLCALSARISINEAQQNLNKSLISQSDAQTTCEDSHLRGQR